MRIWRLMLSMHSWRRSGRKWVCTACPTTYNGAALSAEKKRERCKCGKATEQATAAVLAGHEVRYRAFRLAPLIFCSRCGAYAMAGHARRGKRLMEQCRLPPAKSALTRLLAGQHPRKPEPLDGYTKVLGPADGKLPPKRTSATARLPIIKRRLVGKQAPPMSRRASPPIRSLHLPSNHAMSSRASSEVSRFQDHTNNVLPDQPSLVAGTILAAEQEATAVEGSWLTPRSKPPGGVACPHPFEKLGFVNSQEFLLVYRRVNGAPLASACLEVFVWSLLR